jgi:hypothetical protein
MDRPQCGADSAGGAEEYPMGTHIGGLCTTPDDRRSIVQPLTLVR